MAFINAIYIFVGSAVATNLQNLTILAPDNTTQHGDSHLICPPATRSNIVIFLLVNYFAHAATVVSRPGSSVYEMIVVIINALLCPGAGLLRGYNTCIRFIPAVWSRFCRYARAKCGFDQDYISPFQDDLDLALRGGALCTLVRGPKWRPIDKELVGVKGVVVTMDKKRKGKAIGVIQTADARKDLHENGAEDGANEKPKLTKERYVIMSSSGCCDSNLNSVHQQFATATIGPIFRNHLFWNSCAPTIFRRKNHQTEEIGA